MYEKDLRYEKIFGMREKITDTYVCSIYITTVLSPKFELGVVEKSSRIDYCTCIDTQS